MGAIRAEPDSILPIRKTIVRTAGAVRRGGRRAVCALPDRWGGPAWIRRAVARTPRGRRSGCKKDARCDGRRQRGAESSANTANMPAYGLTMIAGAPE